MELDQAEEKRCYESHVADIIDALWCGFSPDDPEYDLKLWSPYRLAVEKHPSTIKTRIVGMTKRGVRV